MRKSLALALVAAGACLSSCVGNRAYRLRRNASVPGNIESVYRQRPGEPEYSIAFIEFDDRGELFNRKQLSNAVTTIREAKRTAFDRGIHDGAVIVLFVHGWKNNASDASANVHSFRDSMMAVAQSSRVLVGGKPVPRPVVGVYVAWRGEIGRAHV